MKKSIILSIFALFAISNISFAQMAKKQMTKTVSLEQTTGEFTVQELTLSAGTYVFEVANNGVDHAVGFVLAPEGKTDQPNHIKNAYLTATPKDGESHRSNEVTLTPGNYVYFCPMNPTPQYLSLIHI